MLDDDVVDFVSSVCNECYDIVGGGNYANITVNTWIVFIYIYNKYIYIYICDYMCHYMSV